MDKTLANFIITTFTRQTEATHEQVIDAMVKEIIGNPPFDEFLHSVSKRLEKLKFPASRIDSRSTQAELDNLNA